MKQHAEARASSSLPKKKKKKVSSILHFGFIIYPFQTHMQRGASKTLLGHVKALVNCDHFTGAYSHKMKPPEALGINLLVAKPQVEASSWKG